MICSECLLNASERDQDTKKGEPVDIIFDDEKKSLLSDLSPKTITIGICITFFFGLTLLGMISNALKPDESKHVRAIAEQTTITEKKDRKSKQPQNLTKRNKRGYTEKERKVIYKVYISALEAAARDPEYKQLESRMQNGENLNDLRKLLDRQEEIDQRYLKTLV